LALAMMLNAGLDGVRNELAAPPSVDADIFEMTSAEKEQACIASLPGSLEEAIITLKESPIARKTLGEHIFEKYIEGKTKEWDSYRTAVTDWEINRYIKNY
jgi:glutamine synthetase